MGFTTEFFASHLVPRLNIGKPGDAPDGYAHGEEQSVTVDGYVMDLRKNTVYMLQTRTQALYFGMITDADILVMGNQDDAEKLSLLNNSTVINGHYLAAGSTRVIATTARCKTLLMKSATGTAVVNVNPLGSVVDPPDNGDLNK